MWLAAAAPSPPTAPAAERDGEKTGFSLNMLFSSAPPARKILVDQEALLQVVKTALKACVPGKGTGISAELFES